MRRGEPSEAGYSTGWQILLGLEPGMRVLEMSEDGGARAAALAQAGAAVVCLRPSPAQSSALHARGVSAFTSPSGVVEAPETGRFDAVVLSVALRRTRGRGQPTSEFGALLRHTGAALRPGGLLVLSFANPLFRLPGLALLLAALRGARAESRCPEWKAGFHPPLDPAGVRALLLDAGFTSVRVFAPLPVAHRPKFLVPLTEPDALDYFFRHLMPDGRSMRRRAIAHLGRLALKRGAFARLVPSYEVAAAKASAS